MKIARALIVAVGLAAIMIGTALPAAAQQTVSGCAEQIACALPLNYPNFLAKEDGAFSFRRMDKPVTWRTAPVPAQGDCVFVFVGGNHHVGQCELSVNGRYALTFRTNVKERVAFHGEKARLLFDCREAIESRGYSGLYYLRLDKDLAPPDEPVELSARFVCGSKAAWFAVWPRPDVVDVAREAGDLDECVKLLAEFRLTVPPRVPHSVGARVPATVECALREGDRLTARAAVKSLFGAEFNVPAGVREIESVDGRGTCSFEHKNLDPEPMIYVFRVEIARAGRTLLALEADTLLGAERDPIFAQPDQSDYEPYVLSDKVKTPAFPFLKPGFPAEPLKAHFLTRTRYDREIIELAQRLDLRWGKSFVATRAIKFHTATRYVDDIRKTDPDCVVVCNMMWDSFSVDLQKEILTRVSEGMGLVCVDLLKPNDVFNKAVSLNKLDGSPVARGIPLSAMRALTAYGPPEKWIHCCRFGKGRIVLLKYHTSGKWRRNRPGTYGGPLKPDPSHILREDGPVPDELKSFRAGTVQNYRLVNGPPEDPFNVTRGYYDALLIRTIGWAAARDPAARISDVAFEAAEPGPSLRVTVEGARTDLSLSLRVRDRFGDVVLAKDGVPASRGVVVPLPRLNSGLHFADVRLLEDGRVHDFFSTTFDNDQAPVAISAFEPVKPFFVGDEAPSFAIKWRNRSGRGRTIDLELSIDDIWGRMLCKASKTLNVPVGDSAATLAGPRPEASACFVFSAALRAPGTALGARCLVLYPDANRAQREFEFHFWGGPKLDYAAWSRLARIEGFSALTGGHLHPGARWNLRKVDEHVIPMYVRPRKDLPRNVRPNCLDAPDYLKSVEALVDFKAGLLRPCGPAAYSLGHEASLATTESSVSIEDLCMCEHTLAKFRAALERKYKTVDALNRAWNTGFADFAEATPKTYAELTDKTNVAAWMEHRKFMNVNFTGWLAHCAARIRGQDPLAHVGCSGLPGGGIGSFLGFDPYLVSKSLNYFGLYSKRKLSLKMFLSHRQPGGKLIVFTGYDYASPNKVYNVTEPWRYLFRGCTGMSYYHYSGFHAEGEEPGWFHPDFTVSSQGKWFGEAAREVNDGPGMLLFDKKRANNGLGIYVSQNSIHAATALHKGMTIFMLLCSHAANWQWGLEHFGLSPDFISNHQVEADPAVLQKYKVIVFPASVSHSPREMAAIRDFVGKGGTAFVDPLFALYDADGHFMPDQLCPWFEPCPPDLPAQLEDAKAVRRQGEATFDGQTSLVSVEVLSAPPARRLKNGAPVPGLRFRAPGVFLERASVGAGAVYNSSFFQIRDEALALWLRGRLDTLGIDAPLRVVDRQGALVPSLLLCQIPDGPRQFFGIVYSSSGARYQKTSATLKFRRKAHLYDVRRREHLGEVDALEVTLDPMTPLLYCAMPRPVGDFSVTLGAPRVDRGQDLSIEIRSGARAVTPLLFKAWCEQPGGAAPEPLSRKVWVDAHALLRFRIAHNDPPGAWRVHVREAISGKTAVTEVQVVE